MIRLTNTIVCEIPSISELEIFLLEEKNTIDCDMFNVVTSINIPITASNLPKTPRPSGPNKRVKKMLVTIPKAIDITLDITT